MRNEGTLSKRKERELVQSVNVVNKVIEFREVHEFHEGTEFTKGIVGVGGTAEDWSLVETSTPTMLVPRGMSVSVNQCESKRTQVSTGPHCNESSRMCNHSIGTGTSAQSSAVGRLQWKARDT